jgi:hypothetical protein
VDVDRLPFAVAVMALLEFVETKGPRRSQIDGAELGAGTRRRLRAVSLPTQRSSSVTPMDTSSR